MSISPTVIRLLAREHLFKPIEGKMLLLGRQPVPFTYEEVLEIMRSEGYEPSADVVSNLTIEFDTETTYAKKRGGIGKFITDTTFFAMFGITELESMDVSSYESCDIVHNLNEPIPEALVDQYDFIIDGGTFDHLFDIRNAFQNVARLIKPGGRILQWNAASNFVSQAYISFGPDMIYDYFILNKFVDTKVYVAEIDTQIKSNEPWDFYHFSGVDDYAGYTSARMQMVVNFAEKGPDSTYDKIPIQGKYRDAVYQESYEEGKRLAHLSERDWFRPSNRDDTVTGSTISEVKPSWLWRFSRKIVPSGLVDRLPKRVSILIVLLRGNIRSIETVYPRRAHGYDYKGRV